MFSGPQQEPFVCETERAGLGPPSDTDCSVDTRSSYYYRTTDRVQSQQRRIGRTRIPPGFKPLDLSVPRPSDIARTTTTEGHAQDFIVRVERGTINRATYEIAFLHDPADDLPDPWSTAPSWNGRLVYRCGGGCRAGYRQGQIRSPSQDVTSVASGYAVAMSSLNVLGNNCNDVISAETAMMVKEHFIESFGVPVHTIGVGGSGGSNQQHLIAQNYPGLLDGIIPGASYPDTVTLAPPITDCSLLARAIDNSAHDWTDVQKKAVSGFATWATCEILQPCDAEPAELRRSHRLDGNRGTDEGRADRRTEVFADDGTRVSRARRHAQCLRRCDRRRHPVYPRVGDPLDWSLRDKPTEIELPIEIVFQACSEKVCFRPQRKQLVLKAPIGSHVMPTRNRRGRKKQAP